MSHAREYAGENLGQTVARFASGEIDKHAYIREMYVRHHAALFDYAAFLSSTNIRSMEVRDGAVIMTTRDRGIKMMVTPGDHRTAPIEALNFSDYEKAETGMTEQLVRDGDTVLDIGANIGWYSMNLAVARRASRIMCFEPIPATYGALVRNLELNGISNVVANNFGLSDSDNTFTFYFYPEGSGNASLVNLTAREDAQAVQCVVKTMDGLGVQPDFIKCDVEGAELMVLKGGRKTIAQYKPILFLEILRKWSAKFNYNPNEIFRFLREIGYEAFAVGERGLCRFGEMTEETVQTNFFFLHADKHRDEIERYS